MKVLLLNPPDLERIYSELPERLSGEISVLPPLGLLYLESFLAARGGYRVKVLDAGAQKLSYLEIEKEIREFAPQVLGLTGTSQNLPAMLAISENARQLFPALFIVWGGPHSTAFWQSAINFKPVDAVIRGEAEESFHRLLESLKKGKEPEGIAGLVYKKAGKPCGNPSPAVCRDLDALPFPRRESLELSRYFCLPGKEKPASSFSFSRGCPFSCRFCSTPKSPPRERSPLNMVQELEKCCELKIKEIYLVDDSFNLNSEPVKELAKEILKRGLKFSWSARARLDSIQENSLKLLKRAGLSRLQVGVETCDPEGLKILGKAITPQQVKEGIKKIKKAGIQVSAYFMLGLPNEGSKAQILKTIEFARKLNPDYCLFGVLTLYPQTELYQEAVEKGVVDPKAWEAFLEKPSPDFKLPVWKQYFTPRQLEEFLNLAYKKFYLRPGFILKNLLSLRNFPQFLSKARTALRILRL